MTLWTALLLLQGDPGAGPDPGRLPELGRSGWRVGSGLEKPFGFYSLAVHAAFLWVPHLELDVEERVVSGLCSSSLELKDKHFSAAGGVLTADFGPLWLTAGLFAGSFSGTARRFEICTDGAGNITSLQDRTLEIDGDLLAVRSLLYCPVFEFRRGFWRISFGPTAGFIALFESVSSLGGAPIDEDVLEMGATLGAQGAVDYVLGRYVYFTLQVGGSWVLGGSVGGAMPELAFGFGVQF
jgi:hypothetical protein